MNGGFFGRLGASASRLLPGHAGSSKGPRPLTASRSSKICLLTAGAASSKNHGPHGICSGPERMEDDEGDATRKSNTGGDICREYPGGGPRWPAARPEIRGWL